jgi:TRAP-type uncharacterized transport system substrate-binding protein
MLRTVGTILAIAVFAAIGLVSPLSGQPKPLIVSTGDRDGTYVRFFNEIARVCPQPPLRGITSKGSLENVERVVNNQANLGFAQIDVLYAKRLIEHDPYVEQVRTFLVLYLEEVHILIPRYTASIRVFSDLAGKRIGTYGGGSITSRTLFAMTKVHPASVQDFAGPFDAIRELIGDTVDAIIGVGGKPLPWVAALGPDYKLVPFNKYADVSKIYFPGRLEYSNLGQVSPVETVAVPSLLITRDYTKPEITKPLLQLRGCIAKNLEALRETVGNHPKWGQVDPTQKGPWPYFEGTSP